MYFFSNHFSFFTITYVPCTGDWDNYFLYAFCSNTAESRTISPHWRDPSLLFPVEISPVPHYPVHASPLPTTQAGPSHQPLPHGICNYPWGHPLTHLEDGVQGAGSYQYKGDSQCLHPCLHECSVSATVQLLTTRKWHSVTLKISLCSLTFLQPQMKST